MEIDAVEAAALGWPKTKYAVVERERRWLCESFPTECIVRSSSIVDIYISDTQLRLREVRDLSTGSMQFKLTRKADITPSKRIITTIYLSRHEHSLLCDLPSDQIEKTRHTVIGLDGIAITLDQFSGGLSGLLLAEVEFASDREMVAYEAPTFTRREVTGDLLFTGGMLARVGLPVL